MSEFTSIPEHETGARPEPWQMTFEAFYQEYQQLMAAVAVKERNGSLDPTQPNYRPLTDEEQALHQQDWKALSRRRGFTDADIVEYGRWWVLSGQRDQLSAAINDPWRRSRSNHEQTIYRQHIERARENGERFTPEVLTSYDRIVTPVAHPKVNKIPSAPLAREQSSEDLDVW